MISIKFPCTQEAAECIQEIATNMMSLFNISMEEAAGRINKFWGANSFVERLDLEVLFHETEEYWAKHIYYSPEQMWWLSEEGLRPRPYP